MTQETENVKSKTPAKRTYYCRTRTCTEYNRPRTVTLQHLGQELYIESSVICGVCGFPVAQSSEKGFRH